MDLTERLSKLSPAQRKFFERKLQQQNIDVLQVPITRLETDDNTCFPLSFEQERLWFIHNLNPRNSAYNIVKPIKITGNLDRKTLERSINKIIQRHEVLRTIFKMNNEQPVQVILPGLNLSLESINIKGYAQEKQHLEVKEILRREGLHWFDLEKGPLLRILLIELTEREYIFIMTIHHIVTDGMSVQNFKNELLQFYEAYARGNDGTSPFHGLPIRYIDYCHWQRQWFYSGSVFQAKQEEYWLREFRGEIPVLNLPTDFQRPKIKSFAGSSIVFYLEREEKKKLVGIALGEKVSLYVLLLSIFNVLLAKLSGMADIIIGTAIAGRRQSVLQNMMGMFTRTLPLRSCPHPDKEFRLFVSEVKERVLKAFENQEYQFEELVGKVLTNQDTARNPLFEVMFDMENLDSFKSEMHVPGLDLKLREYTAESFTSMFDMTLFASELDGRLCFTWEYCTKLFKKSTIIRFSNYFKQLIAAVTGNMALRIADIDILPPREKRRILQELNDTSTEYPQDKRIHNLLAEQVEKTPDRTAIIAAVHITIIKAGRVYRSTGKAALTYRDFSVRSGDLAHLLKVKGIKIGSIAAVMVDRSLEMMVALLGILRAGGAYLPIDPAYPKDRTAYILADSGADILVTSKILAKKIEPYGSTQVETIFIDEINRQQRPGIKRRGEPCVRPPGYSSSQPLNFSTSQLLSSPELLAYVIYTSGTTGRPKGVMIEHRSVVNFIKGITDILEFGAQDRILSLTTISFDIFALESFLPLTKGSRIIIGTGEEQMDGAATYRTMVREKINILQLTPSRLQLLIADEKVKAALGSLKYLLLGGEPLTEQLLAKARDAQPGKIYNLYGPTEATIWVTVKDVSKGESLNIGKPIANTRVYILDRNLKPVPVGVHGSLYLSGIQLAPGYLNNPELTAMKFIFFASGGQGATFNDQSSMINHQLKICDEKTLHHNLYSMMESHKRFPTHVGPWTPAKTFNNESAVPLEQKRRGEPCVRPFLHPETDVGARRAVPLELPNSQLIYSSGDLARWLPDGNIELSGRLDHQVKIRGFRIEPGEIENQLLSHKDIKEAVVTIRNEKQGDKYLCAYIVGSGRATPAIQLDIAEIREYLSQSLPGYMIPSYFVQLNTIPLTANGKVDSKTLPEPGIAAVSTYVEPRSLLEKKLVQLWQEVLFTGEPPGQIGIDDNFFELGGHSMKATVLTTRIRRELASDLPLSAVFEASTIRQLARYIAGRKKRAHLNVPAVEKKEYYQLSSAQKGLYLMQQMDPDCISYVMERIMLLKGRPDKEKMEHTFRRLIRRHESLRTSFHMVNNEPVQKIHNPEDIIFNIEDIGADRFIHPIELNRTPLLRVGLQKQEENKNILIVAMHHIIYDGISMEILIREFIKLYGDGCAGSPLAPLRVQYKDFSGWLNRNKEHKSLKKQESFWLEEFSTGIPTLALPKDSVIENGSGCAGFEIEAAETRMIKDLALQQDATLFMVLSAVWSILISKLCGQEDVVSGTPAAGRNHTDAAGIIGIFVNMLLIRNRPSADKTFTTFLREVKNRTLSVFENQDYRYEDLADRFLPQMEPQHRSLFDVVFIFQNIESTTGSVPEIEFSGLKITSLQQEYETVQMPYDLILVASEAGEKLIFSLSYKKEHFKKETILLLVENFKKIIAAVIENSHIRLRDITLSHELMAAESYIAAADQGDFAF